MVLHLYADPVTINSHKVLAALKHMGVDYKLVHVDFVTRQHKSPDYLKINPNGTLPTAVDDGLIITESNAIMQHAAETCGNSGAEAYPTDLKQRALVNCWLFWEAFGWFKSNYVYLYENVLKRLEAKQPDEAAVADEQPRWFALADVLNTQLGKTKYIIGDTVTIADFAIMSPMHLYTLQKLPLDGLPDLKRWMADMEKVPAWHTTQSYVNKIFRLDNYVRATLNYSKDIPGRPTEVYFFEHEKAAAVHMPGEDCREVLIYDGWSRKDDFSVDKHGFCVQPFKSMYPKDSWNDDQLVKNQFYPEIVQLLQNVLGARRVLVFDHTIRTKVNEAKKLTDEQQTSQRTPVQLVHCDYTSESAPLRVRQLLPDEADDLLSRRVAFLNVWKPLSKVEEMPLAMCDVTSSAPSDFFKLYLRYRDRTGENYVMRYSANHRWYYFPEMDEEHCIFLKTYDSDESRARFVGHSAFEDPMSRNDAPLRESIEIRTMVFF